MNAKASKILLTVTESTPSIRYIKWYPLPESPIRGSGHPLLPKKSLILWAKAFAANFSDSELDMLDGLVGSTSTKSHLTTSMSLSVVRRPFLAIISLLGERSSISTHTGLGVKYTPEAPASDNAAAAFAMTTESLKKPA